MAPPLLPLNVSYTPYWCEENIYLLCQTFLADPQISNTWDTYCVFISNQGQSVALWNQKKARESGLPVVWDYHVVLLLRPRFADVASEESWIYDFDADMPIPCPGREYMEKTFRRDMTQMFQSQFRVISGEVYLDNFASDRTHMSVQLKPVEEMYQSPPPKHAPIEGKEAIRRGMKTNLMSEFVTMEGSVGFGRVTDLEEMLELCDVRDM
ncbi:hypothetical protein AMATHDRAFT_74213 [Amanita thiersii Skay4041]|uniref:Protein N-terminal glutamine amidohydrolase n=1 Tax=Amanita thiersii Skay4041 TaxID=703135 RepID=A0A2A9NXE4_9AGAR|nr:hypothetical protein AMATHDRAFT_74213 [Amanita thiersii Skay4041]